MRVAVVGAGPAGLAAACAAGEGAASVTVIDDNAAPGGRIWRGAPYRWSRRLTRSNIERLCSTSVIAVEDHRLLVECGGRALRVEFDRLILAPGARELFLPFPGWTLPGVAGAGGLQALVKAGFRVRGKRVIVAGTGPLLLAVASYLSRRGAKIPLVAEQASWRKVLHFASTLPLKKHLQALTLWRRAYSPNTWITNAHGRDRIERVTCQKGDRQWDLECDYLAIGYGLYPNRELAELLGVDASRVTEFQQSSSPDIYCAGEITGIGGVDLALIEGSIAGYAAAGRLDKARKYFAERARWKQFALGMAAAFSLRPELKGLARGDTLVCRCEDVTLSRIQEHSSWRAAKLHTRCGMGPCQGRICGPATEFLLGWRPDSVRLPLFPARVESLILGGREKQ